MASVSARTTRPVTVVIPHKGVDKIDSVHKMVANTLGRLGCGGCFSGFDIRFSQMGDLVVNPHSLEVNEAG